MRKRWLNVLMLVALLCGTLSPLAVQAGPTAAPPDDRVSRPDVQEPPQAQIEQTLVDALGTEGTGDFVVVLAEQADLSAAYGIDDWAARGRYVYDTLLKISRRAQSPIVDYAKRHGLAYQSFLTTNSVHIQGGTLRAVQDLASLPGVALVRAPKVMQIDPASAEDPQPQATTAYGWNLDTLAPDSGLYGMQATQVWDAYGVRGNGIVVANIDTGVTYQHEALNGQYRGNLGTAYDHDFSWYAPTAAAELQCSGNAAGSPCDSDGHGSGTAGIMVGETADLTEQLGVAPAAEWIACMGCDLYGPGGEGGCSEAALTACADWMVAPCPIGADPGDPSCDPDMRPNIVNNSWGGDGGDAWYRGYIQAWTAAGIFPAFSAGNSVGCALVGSPGDNPEAFGTAAHGSNGQNLYAGGPSAFYPNPSCDPEAFEVDPHLNAPTYGRTAAETPGTYYNIGGTSGASPHTAGAVALVWSANPWLIGDIDETFRILEQSADRTSTQSWREGTCGKPACAGSDPYPNYCYGWGYLDALAAVDEALALVDSGTLQGVVTDSSTGDPVADVDVTATMDGVQVWQTTTDELGRYALTVFSGDHTVTAAKYGYLTRQVTGVTVATDQTTTVDVPLTPAVFHTVNGTISDATTGWPLYAGIEVAGHPGGAIWTDPTTGHYSVDLAEGVPYTLTIAAWTTGYEKLTAEVGPLTGDATRNFALEANLTTCSAPGYEAVVDPVALVTANFDAGIPADWDVVNNGGTCVWTDTNPGSRANLTGGTGNFAIGDLDICGMGTSSDTELRTPVFDASAYDALQITYQTDYYDLDSLARVDVYNGAIWVNAEALSGASQRGPQTRTVAAAVDAAPTAQVRWHYAGGWDWWWQVDDVRINGLTCVPPNEGGLVVGSVHDANQNHALTGALVTADTGSTATATPTLDPAVSDAFYSLYLPAGSRVLTASIADFQDDVAAVTVVSGATVREDFRLGAGYLTATPAGVEVTLAAGDAVKETLVLDNQGAADAQYTLIEQPGGYIPAGSPVAVALPIPDGGYRLELASDTTPVQATAAGPWLPDGSVTLVVDDGSVEDAVGLSGGGQFIWLNRFTPDPTTYPFTLDQVALLFSDGAVVGESIELVIWEDTDGDGDPGTGAAFRSAETVTVQNNDATTWNVYTLSAPVYFTGLGDVLIGAANRDASGAHPAAIDTTASQGRSWVGIYSSAMPDPPTLPPDAAWGTIDALAFPGNWALRGSGVTGTGDRDAIPWLTEIPISGTVASGEAENVLLAFDASLPETNQPGTYYGELSIHTDTPYAAATVPVTMTVTAPTSWGAIAGTVSSLGYCDRESNPLDAAEVTLTSNSGAAWTLSTDATGAYELWLDTMYSPLTVTASYSNHVTTVLTNVVLTGGETTITDIGLRWVAPCVTVEPIPLTQTLELGTSATVPLTLTNSGPLATSFSLSEFGGGYTIASPAIAAPAPSAALNPTWVEAGETQGETVLGTASGNAAPDDIGTAWETMAPLPAPRVFNAVVADSRGYLYVIGGTSDAGGSTSTATTYRYDTATDTWETMAPVPVPLMAIDGVAINDKIYIPGDQTTANTYVYDTATDTWSTLPANGGYTARSQYQVVAIDSDLIVLGGIVAAAGASTTEVWVLDTTTGAWSAGIAMQKSRTSFSAGAIDGTIFVAGGVVFPGFAPDMTAEAFDGTSWRYVASVPDGGGAYTRWSYNADGIGTDGLWLGAGRRDLNWTVLNHAAVYDPDTNAWTDSPTIPALAQSRVYMEGDVASDGYFYVVGGRDSGGATVYSTNERLQVGYRGPEGDIPWLSQSPITGTLAADSITVVDVTFDATGGITDVTQPGDYAGTLYVAGDDVMAPSIAVPVTMTVTPPATWGKVTGTVTSLGYCDGESKPIAGTEVLIEAGDGTTWTVQTDRAGAYSLWLDATHSPVAITVAVPEHETGEAPGVVVAAGATTTQDLALTWLKSCVSPSPEALAVTLELGDTTSLVLSVANNGALAADWALREQVRGSGFVPITPLAGEDVLVVAYDGTAAAAMEAALTSNGYTYVQVTRTTFEAMSTADLLTYGAVLYAGGSSADGWSKMIAYLEAGGRLLIADNDLGYSNFGTAFYQQYLQATYTSDSGSDGVLTGVDIMAGINPDISPDDFPDDFTINGPDAVGIFVAPSTRWAGLRIARIGYRAIYLAWEFDDTAGTTDETAILDRALDWLGVADAVPWMDEEPLSGSAGAYGSDTTTITFDAGVPEVDQPGDYLARINVYAPADPVTGGFAVPVTMTVTAPPTWALLSGTVSSLGHCDSDTAPLASAKLTITGGTSAVVTTGDDGTYGYWLAPGRYTVSVSADGHQSAQETITIVAGVGQTLDVDLRLLQPCVSATPASIEATLAMGETSDHLLTIVNNGAGDATFSFSEATAVTGTTPTTDLPWLSEAPATGSVAGDDTTDVTVTFDAGQVPGPGLYAATLTIESEDPTTPQVSVSVTLTATLPATYGRIMGTVHSTGYCDEEMIPLADAAILIEDSSGVTTTVRTGSDGVYEVWRAAANGPYTVTATYADHREAVATDVIVTGSETTVQDFSLRSLEPCIRIVPAALTVDLTMGMSTTTHLTVTNAGAEEQAWWLSEGTGGFTPLASAAGPAILLMVEGIDVTGQNTYRDALAAAGLSWDEWNLDALSFPTAGDLAAYDVLIWADESTLTPGDADCQIVADWLVSGSKALFATSIDFLWDLENGTVGQGEHNLYDLLNTTYQGDYAGTGIPTLTGVSGDPIGDGLTLALAGTADSNGDYAATTGGAPTGFLYDAGGLGTGYAALTHYEGTNYKTVWLGVNFHNGLTSQTERNRLMANVMTFLGGRDVPWLAENPESGTTAMDSASTVTVTFDAGVPEVTGPGHYTTTLTLTGNDATLPEITVPVTMTVHPPATWGKLTGTVTGLGYCNGDEAPIEGATVAVESATESWTLSTDADGTYGLWLDAAHSPLTVIVSAGTTYGSRLVTEVELAAGETTTLDAALRWLQPCVTTADAVEITLQAGAAATTTLNLANGGARSTAYNLVEQDLGFRIADALASTFGYTVADSNFGDGPAYDFVDISAFATPIALGDDTFAGPVPIGFDFPFYGASAATPNIYDEVFVNSNGFLSFGTGSTDLSNEALPSLLTPNDIIALMWDDLEGGTAYAYSFDTCPYAPGVCMVVQYEGFTHMDGKTAGTWQAILFRSGSILVQFEDAGAYAGATSTTGIENAFGTDGLSYASDSAVLEDGLAVCFAYPGNGVDCVPTDVVWLAAEPTEGTLAADSVVPVTLSFDAAIPETSQPGAYMAALHLATNDPYNGELIIPVTMTVEAPASWARIGGTVMAWDRCDATSAAMDGATVFVESANGTDSWALTTDADGDYALWLDAAHAPVTVTVSAAGYVPAAEVVTFGEGDAVDSVHNLRSDTPCFTTDPQAIAFTVTKGHTHTEQLMLTNLGAGMLDISAVTGDGWMTPDMTTGSVVPGESHPMAIVFSAAGMAVGEHTGTLVIAGNDPQVPLMAVPVTMTVLVPVVDVELVATPSDVAHPGETIAYAVTVTNTGDGPLAVDLTAAIPAHTTYIGGSQTGGLVYIVPPVGDARVTWSSVLTPMAPKTFTFAVRVDRTYTDGAIEAQVDVATADATFIDTASVRVKLYERIFPIIFKNAP